jgi:hypothetical protein
MWFVMARCFCTSYSLKTSFTASGFSCDLAALQRLIDAVDVDRDRFGAQRPEGVGEHLARRQADPEAFEILRQRDRPAGRGGLPHAVVERADGEAMNAFGRHLLAQVGAQRAVGGFVRLGRRPEGKGDLLHLGDRHRLPQDAAHQREEVEFARDQHFERCRIGAGNASILGEYLGGDAAVGLCADRQPHLDEAPMQRARGRLVMELAELVVSGHRWTRDEFDRGEDSAAGENRAARQDSWHDRAAPYFSSV